MVLMNNLKKFVNDYSAVKWVIVTIFLIALSTSLFEIILLISFVNLSNIMANADTSDNLRIIINHYQNIFPKLHSQPDIQAILSFFIVFAIITVLKICRTYVTSVGVSKLGAVITEKYLTLLLETKRMKDAQEISFAQSNLSRVQSIVFAFLIPLCNVMSSAVVLLVIIMSSFYMNAYVPFISLIASAFIATLFQVFIQKKISRRSLEIDSILPHRLKNIESINASYHQRKLSKNEEIKAGYLTKFQNDERSYFLNNGIVNFLIILPRPVLEICFLSIFISVTFISFIDDGINALLLLNYLMLTIRTVPYVTEFYFNLNKAKSMYPQFATYVSSEKKYSYSSTKTKEDCIQGELIERKPTHISARKVGSSQVVEFGLETDQWTVISGKSGSGKSSLVDALIYGGNSQWICSHPLISSDYIISYVPQSVKTIGGTHLHNIQGHYQETKPNLDLFTFVDLLELNHIFTNDTLDRDFSHISAQLSGGELKRIGLLTAILNQPDILFIDESFGSISSAQETRILRKLEKVLPKCKIIVIAHRSIEFFKFSQTINIT